MSNDHLVTDRPLYARIPEWVLYHPDLPSTAVRLYGVLERHAGDKAVAWPGRARLAELLDCTESTVTRAVRDLERIGALTVTARFRENGGQTSNLYELTWTPLRENASPPLRENARPPFAKTRGHEREQGNESKKEAAALPAEHAVIAWADVTGTVATRAVIRRQIGPAGDFLRSCQPGDRLVPFLEWAHSRGCWSVGGWASFWAQWQAEQRKEQAEDDRRLRLVRAALGQGGEV